MAFTTMHFAAGMIGSGVIGAGMCIIFRRGWRWVPVGMTLGGLWALAPDMPRLFREDFPSLPLAGALGSKDLERYLHDHGDVFFAHARLDAQPHEFALHGLIIIIALYSISMLGYAMALSRRKRQPPEPKVAARQGRAPVHATHRAVEVDTANPEGPPSAAKSDVIARIRISDDPPSKLG